jgi:hypothetical protein
VAPELKEIAMEQGKSPPAGAALSKLHPQLVNIYESTRGLDPAEITPARLRKIRDAVGTYVTIRLQTDGLSTAAGPAVIPRPWAKLSDLTAQHATPLGCAEPGVGGVFLVCKRRPWADMPPAAREANGLLLLFGAAPADPWTYGVVPPPALQYVRNVEGLPSDAEVVGVKRAEDATRVTVTVHAAELRVSTASCADAQSVNFYHGETMINAVQGRLKGRDVAALFDEGFSYTFMLRTQGLQPMERGADRMWFSQRVCHETLALDRDPHAVWGAAAPFEGQEDEEARGGKLLGLAKRREHGQRPLYGFVILTRDAPKFIESAAYREIRTTLYEPDPMDREIGPEGRLRFRALRAWLTGTRTEDAFRRLFPELADTQMTQFAHTSLVACERVLVRVANNGRSGDNAAQLDRETERRVRAVASGPISAEAIEKGVRLGDYFWPTVRMNNELLVQLRPTATGKERFHVDCYVRQPSHLDPFARELIDGMALPFSPVEV